MKPTFRNYKALQDFGSVYRFLESIYSLYHLNSYLLPQFFEYAHTHSMFDLKRTHRFGLWEDSSGLVGIACYEMELGECLLATKREYKSLLPEMLDYAEKELSKNENGTKTLNVFTTGQDIELRELLLQNSYTLEYCDDIKTFDYKNPFVERTLPNGFSIVSLEAENDLQKINTCLWKGFDHGDTPDGDLDGDRLMQSSPHYRRDLATVIKAPNGEYACYAGMWLDEVNHYAYLEPLATVPEYRRMGLATIALTESMKKTKALGAKYCFGGSREFYTDIGFETIERREFWKKQWK